MSSALVDSVDPPQYWTELDAGYYLAIADSYLSRPNVESYLEKHCAPSAEPTFCIRREADVVAYSATHLTHAPNMALGGVIFPGKIEMVSELGEEGCRVDCVWRETKSRKGDPVFAALEMKISGVLEPEFFAAAKLTEAMDPWLRNRENMAA